MWRRENAWEKQTERQTECPTWWDQLGNHFGHVQTKKVVSLETAITCTHTQNNFSHILFSAWYNKLGWKLRGTIAHPVLTDPSALPMPQSRPPARPPTGSPETEGLKTISGGWQGGARHSYQCLKTKIYNFIPFWKAKRYKNTSSNLERLQETLQKTLKQNLAVRQSYMPKME